MVSTLALAALIRAKPAGPFWARDWLDGVLERSWSGFRGPTGRGWSIGCVLGNETLVQSRPSVRDTNGRFLDDMLRTAAPCTITAFGWAGQDAVSTVPGVSLGRFRRFIGAVDVGSHAIDQAALTAALPEFLARARSDRTDRELVFLTYLALLQERGGLGATYPEPDQIRDALHALRERIGPELSVMTYDGRTVGFIHGRGTMLALEPPPEPGRRRSPTGDNVARSGLIVVVPGDPLPEPFEDAERIAPGIFTISPTKPLVPVR